jgi:hypothetical protein
LLEVAVIAILSPDDRIKGLHLAFAGMAYLAIVFEDPESSVVLVVATFCQDLWIGFVHDFLETVSSSSLLESLMN